MKGIENFRPVQRPVEKTEIKYIQANSIAELEKTVNEKLCDNWELYRGLIIKRGTVYQAIIKKVG